jgi:hypothetical protein
MQANNKRRTMTKKLLLFLFSGLLLAGQLSAQTRRIDTVAVAILDKMSAVIGELSSCSVSIRSNYDVASKDLGLVKHSDDQQLFLHGPNQLLLKSDGDQGSRDFYFDGKTLSYYSLDKNQYGQIEAPANLVEMMDTVNKVYGIEFPAADFFYPTFVDDILVNSTTMVYLGLARIDGKDCYHVAGMTADKSYQFWISDDAYTLPMKMVIIYTHKPLNPQYEATLSGWQVNPSLPDALFTFTVPHKARKVKLMPLSAKK